MEKEDREKEKEEGNLGEISEIFICCEAEKKISLHISQMQLESQM